MNCGKLFTRYSINEFLPYIYGGHFFPQSIKCGNVDNNIGSFNKNSSEKLLDFIAFSDIIENDVF